ncbi:MAG: glucose-1-phosphate adenylyltransferase subunit GlgD, partial [Lachnospiraceae bacterium]|nr:glucose-1-phosphate adenylyltransferase subunit GlgD [Lachnospiraceae bacterium]
PSAKYNSGARVRNSLVSSGCIINGVVEDSILFKKVYIGDNCVIRNSIILNDVRIGNDTVIENCIVESRGTIPAGKTYISNPDSIKVIVEAHDRFSL